MISAIYLIIIALVTCVLYSIVCKRQIAIGGDRLKSASLVNSTLPGA